jgi:hypothetical protein
MKKHVGTPNLPLNQDESAQLAELLALWDEGEETVEGRKVESRKSERSEGLKV